MKAETLIVLICFALFMYIYTPYIKADVVENPVRVSRHCLNNPKAPGC